MQIKKQQLELHMEQQTGSRLVKECIKAAVYCHPAYLTYMQSPSCEMRAGWSTRWNQDARGNINNLRYADDTTLTAESKEELKNLLMKVREESEKPDLTLNIQKTKTVTSGSIASWQIDGETVETVTDYFLGLKNHCRWWLQPWNWNMLAPWKKRSDKTR